VATPQVAVDRDGNAVLVWGEVSGLGIYARSFSVATGAWSADALLVTSAVVTADSEPCPLLFDAKGVATMVCDNTSLFSSTRSIVAARRAPVTGQWSSARVDRAATGMNAQAPGVVVDDAGTVTVAWNEATATSPQLKASRFDATTSSWSSPVVVGAAGSGVAPRLLADGAGNVTAIVVLDGRIQAAEFAIGSGAWQAPVAVDPAATGLIVSPARPVAAIDASGTVAAAWFGASEDQQGAVLANVFR